MAKQEKELKETKTGFQYTVDVETLDDWEILEIIDEIEENPQKAVSLAKRILGKEQYGLLKEHVKKNNQGKLPIEAVFDEISDIMNGSNELKK